MTVVPINVSDHTCRVDVVIYLIRMSSSFKLGLVYFKYIFLESSIWQKMKRRLIAYREMKCKWKVGQGIEKTNKQTNKQNINHLAVFLVEQAMDHNGTLN